MERKFTSLPEVERRRQLEVFGEVRMQSLFDDIATRDATDELLFTLQKITDDEPYRHAHSLRKSRQLPRFQGDPVTVQMNPEAEWGFGDAMEDHALATAFNYKETQLNVIKPAHHLWPGRYKVTESIFIDDHRVALIVKQIWPRHVGFWRRRFNAYGNRAYKPATETEVQEAISIISYLAINASEE